MTSTPAEMELNAQLQLLSYIQNFIRNSVDKIAQEKRTLVHFENRLVLLESYWDKFFNNDALLLKYKYEQATQCHEYFAKELFHEGESAYISTKTVIQGEINKLLKENIGLQAKQEALHLTNNSNVTHLESHSFPKLDIPQFDGSQDEWDTWKELFTAMVIQNLKIPNAVKLQQLLNCVHGPAKAALKGVSASSADFQVAWDKLLRRYDITKHKLFNYLEAFIDIPRVQNASAANLSCLVDRAEEIVKGLKDLKCSTEHFNIWFVHLIERKLDPDTRLSWAIHEENVEGFSTYESILKFLECRITSLKTPNKSPPQAESSRNMKTKGNNNTDRSTNSSNKQINSHVVQDHSSKSKIKDKKKLQFKCPKCTESHSLYNCQKFLALTADGRANFIKLKGMCECCFSSKHVTISCPKPFGCSVDGCRGKHNTLLHKDARSLRSHNVVPIVDSVVFSDNSTTNNCAYTAQPVLLATAKILLIDKNGDKVCVNALIDQGSMRSFVSERVVSALNLEKLPIAVHIKGVGNTSAGTTKGFCHLILASPFDCNFKLAFSALILGQLTSQLPSREIKVSKWSHLGNLKLADPEFMKPKHIDCILGADVYTRIILNGIRTGPQDTPMAQNTRLGWILTGLTCPMNRDCLDAHIGICINSCLKRQDTSISDALVKMWEVDRIPTKTFLTPEETACEEHFNRSVFRVNGRFGVRLPFKSTPNFPGSREIAIKSFSRLQTRLAKNSKLKADYDNFMKEYLELKHMERIPPEEVNKNNVYYIPHHAIRHHGKIRVVFNASMPSFNGISLNSTLYTGQKLQQDIVLVLIKWRCFKVVFTCDIVKMFRQILIDPRDRDWLRIVYDFGQGVEHFRLCTVTYGTSCAPYQSLRVLLEIVKRYCANLPKIKMLLRELSYVDDTFAGSDSIEDALEIRNNLIEVLSRGNIKLGKWSANDNRLLVGLSNVDQNDKTVRLHELTNALGLKWSPTLDTFSFIMEQRTNLQIEEPTKRKVLSESSKLFDPLGLVSPILISFKIFLQDLWMDGLDWDTPLNRELSQIWENIRSQLDGIEKLKIPRWLGSDSHKTWSLHGFADASKRAYSACIYYVPNIGIPALICSKVKVAPVKTISITKLELSAAHLLSKLIEYVLPTFPIKPVDIHCWSDSRNVLCLLKLAPAKLKVFEANRVSDVVTILPNVRWKYVPTKENPADCATRGLSAEALRMHSLWWAGPPWLPNDLEWPHQLDLIGEDTLSTTASLHAMAHNDHCWLDGFSSLDKLVRAVATAKKWLFYIRNKNSYTLSSSLTVQELSSARTQIIRFDQSRHFPKEIDLLKVNKNIPRRSKLARSKPFLDNEGILRMGSRVENCPFLTYDEKYPIILSRHSSVSRMLAWDYHRMYLHGGPKLVLSAISRKYFIICGMRVVKSVLCKCSTCLRYSGRCLSQQMAPLPRDRLEFTYPFAATGLDYAGPIKVTPSRGRGITSSKGYICVFICLVTRAIHVEIVSDLSTKAFLAAFDRFTNRRGLPESIRSDNGKTFVGAEREISMLFKPTSPQFQEIQKYINNLGITWSFSPPYGPHFGGQWEAAVKSFKFHYKRVLGENPLTFEEHSTLAAQIEGCLNSRPVCTISSDSRDPVPLTPGHFLIGRPLRTLPPSSTVCDPTKFYSNRYTLLLAIKNSFWKTWKKEVLHQLMEYNKWYFPQRNLQVGDIVIIKEEATPPAYWPLGKVIEVEKDRSGLVRVVKVKTESSSLMRPIHKLIYLPISEQAFHAYSLYQCFIKE